MLFTEVRLELKAPSDDEGLLRAATAAIHEFKRYSKYGADVQVTLSYKGTSTQVTANSTPEGLIAEAEYKLSPSYGDNSDRTSQ